MELTGKIRQYITGRCSTKLEPLDKELAKAEKDLEPDALSVFKLDWLQRRVAMEDKFKVDVWLTDAAKRAGQISLVTHALKYTHSDAKGSSVMAATGSGVVSSTWLTSQTLSTPKADVVGNAAVLDVANLLLLESEGKRLLDWIAEGSIAPFDGLAADDQKQAWLEGFKAALGVIDPASHTLAKQIYFPVNEATGYHLLAPLSASSLNHAVFERVQTTRFSDDAQAARDARKKGVFWHQGTRDYLDLAIQTFGGTKPQNISLLNSQRRGRVYLFNTQPPFWQSRIQPPKSSSGIWKGYLWRVRKPIRELKSFLEWANKSNQNNFHIRTRRAAMVATLVGELHQYAASLQQLPAGWSLDEGINITEQEACWLDPGRSDEEFVSRRQDKAWCKTIAQQFGRTLSSALTTKKLLMADDEVAYFSKQIRLEAKRLMIDLEEIA
jgi:CRISPR-associated protein Csy1